MPGAAVEMRRAITDVSTTNTAFLKATTCFKRAVTMQDKVSCESDTEKTLAFAALLSDDILDGVEVLDELIKHSEMDNKTKNILIEDRKNLNEIVAYAQNLEEESKKQLDRTCRNEFVELFKIKRLLGDLAFMMTDLKIILVRIEDVRLH